MHHFIDEVYFLFVFVHLDHLADVRVIKLFQQFNFLQKFAPLAELQIFLPHHLDGPRNAAQFVHTPSHSAQGTLSDNFMQIEVILDVVAMSQVKFFWIELNSVRLVGLVIVTVFHQIFEILTRKLDKFFGLLADHLLNKVLQDSWEGVGDFDLLSGENPHLPHI